MDHGHESMTGMDGMDGTDSAAGGHDHSALPPLTERRASASESEREAADALWAATRATLVPYENVDNALAAGFVPNRSQLNDATIHYPNPANRRDNHQLDPSRPEGLVYHHDADGTYHLMGAVYTVNDGEPAPTPGGPIFAWHAHNGCDTFLVAPGACTDTFRMLHVWTATAVVDPFTQPFSAAVRAAA